jgi:hypothetical protein
MSGFPGGQDSGMYDGGFGGGATQYIPSSSGVHRWCRPLDLMGSGYGCCWLLRGRHSGAVIGYEGYDEYDGTSLCIIASSNGLARGCPLQHGPWRGQYECSPDGLCTLQRLNRWIRNGRWWLHVRW